MADDSFVPQIDSPWILAMICCGVIGFVSHAGFVCVTSHHYFTGVDSRKGKLFIVGCVLLLCFNMLACLLWAVARTDIIIPLSHVACKFIYASNFLSYFLAKYILHCLLIFRIYMTFRDSALAMSFRSLVTFISIVSVNFFVAMAIWTISIAPHVLQGQWTVNGTQYRICTLFSNQAHQNLSVKLSAITVGIEDFLVGTITLVVFLRRFRQIAMDAQDIQLFEASTRFGVASFFSHISTLFLFTFAIPFYPNFTFILAIDATINSLCLFCVLSVGQDLYWYVCAPCRIAGNRWFDIKRLHPELSAAELAGYFMNASQQELKANCAKNQLNQVTITTASGRTKAVLAPLDGILADGIEVQQTSASVQRRNSSARLDPVVSSILVKSNSTHGVSTKHTRLMDERPQVPIRLRQTESEPVPIVPKKRTPIKLKAKVSNPHLKLFG